MPRRCTICSHNQTDKINSAVIDGNSYRHIAKQFNLDHSAVFRHIDNCLKLDFQAIDSRSKSEQVVDVKKRFAVNLRKAERFSDAAEKWLDINGEIEIDARAHEVEVVYYDSVEKTALKWPKQRKATLQSVIDWVLKECQGAIEIDRVNVKIMDPRKFALEALDKTDMCLNRFAMIFGEYKDHAPNPETVETALASFNSWLEVNPSADINQRVAAIKDFARFGKVDPQQLAIKAGIQNIEAVQ